MKEQEFRDWDADLLGIRLLDVQNEGGERHLVLCHVAEVESHDGDADGILGKWRIWKGNVRYDAIVN